MNEIDRRPSRRRSFALVIALSWAIIATGMLVARASHNFSDVPTTAFYHNAVEWVFIRGMTAGCAVGLYCPDANVTRGQMAVFLQKEGQVLTPTVITQAQAFAVDYGAPGNAVRICRTTSDYTPTYPQQALVRANLRFIATSAGGNDSAVLYMQGVYSTDSGTTWQETTPDFYMAARSNGALDHVSIPYSGFVNLTAGTSYRFGMRVTWPGIGTTSAISAGCILVVEIVNRNP